MKKLFLFLAVSAMMLPAIISAQPQIKENIEEIKSKIGNVTRSLADIKSNTDGIADALKKMKENFPADFFSPDMLENLKDAMKEFKDNMTEETAAIKKFRGPDFKCGPGSQCFKFKKDIQETFSGIEKLRNAILGTEAVKFSIAGELAALMEKSPGFGLYPVYRAIGPMVTTLSNNLNELTKDLEALKASAGQFGTNPAAVFKGFGPRHYDRESFTQYASPSITDDYVDLVEIKEPYSGFNTASFNHPVNNIDTNISMISIDNFCSSRIENGTRINRIRVGMKVVLLVAKFMEEHEGKEVEAGGSLGPHVAAKKQFNFIKNIGVLLEGLLEISDQWLDNVSGNLDMCDNMRAAKALADNQKVIIENQKLIFEALEKIKNDKKEN